MGEQSSSSCPLSGDTSDKIRSTVKKLADFIFLGSTDHLKYIMVGLKWILISLSLMKAILVKKTKETRLSLPLPHSSNFGLAVDVEPLLK